MSESVFHTFQLAQGAGTFLAPGSSQDAAVIYPVSEHVVIDLDRATKYPDEDYGRNVHNHAGRGAHGVRGATFSITSEARFQDIMEILELHNTGNVSASGGGPYTWPYPLETGAPTLIPATGETGTETSQDQYEAIFLIDELTMGFDDLDAPGAHPWTVDASCMAISRTAAALTGSLSAPATLESMQGHLTVIKWGDTATAFASLTELSASLISCQIATQRHLVLRPYGSTGDTATSFGFSEKTSGTFTAKLKVSSGNKTAVLDAWEAAGAVLGEKRVRIEVDGSGNNLADWDARLGMITVGISDRDGERVYEVNAEIVDDSTLDAPCQWTITNDVATLASAA